MQDQIRKLITQMTLEEKASLCSGNDEFNTKPLERLGIPAIMMADGPHGLRKVEGDGGLAGAYDSKKAVCFPAACATACSFDRELLYEMGKALGEECQTENVAVLLGPGANLKRSPLCGRNFEYFSEDPYHSSQMATAYIEGVQGQKVGVSLKHFAANNQETRRMSISANISERALRELYLASFENAVIEGKPCSVMCSYNRINGTYSSENPYLLTKVLRDEWGYEGFVVSDWGAVNDRVKGIAAGLELEMPSSNGRGDASIVAAVKSGELDEAVVDRAVEKILKVVLNWQQNHTGKPYDKEAHHALARRIENESMVLLKNDGILPLQEGKKYAFIGGFAAHPRMQGSGSSHVNSFKIESALQEAQGLGDITYAKGFSTEQDETDPALLREAIEVAEAADAAVVFAGLPSSFESEGFDRDHMDLPHCQSELIAEIAKVQPNVVVVLHNGAPVTMPWLDDVKGLLEAYIGGQAVGGAVADVLFGMVNPSGKLAETFPRRVEDNPSYINFPGELEDVDYSEGLFIGYRYYDKRKMDVLFPFGYGLSYTTFAYESIELSTADVKDTDQVTVTVRIRNTGQVKGKEVIQLYVADCESGVIRPEKELKGFEKIELAPGESGEVTFILDSRSYAYWDTAKGDWRVESGAFTVYAGPHSRHLPLSAVLQVTSTDTWRRPFHINSTLEEVLKNPAGHGILMPYIDAFLDKLGSAETDEGVSVRDAVMKMALNAPLRGLINLPGGIVTAEMVEQLLAAINQ